MRSAQASWSRGEAGALAALAAFSSLVLAWPIVSYDAWWHLAAGRDIVTQLAIPRADPYSHTLRGSPWVDFEWLSQVLAYLAWTVTGFRGLIWLKALVGASAVVITARSILRQGADLATACAGALCALAMVRTRGFLGPEIFSLALFAFFLYALLRFRDAESGRSGRAWLVALPPLTALWANLHGGFVLGHGLIALSAAGAFLESPRGAGRRTAKSLLLCLAACLLASLVNPYGAGVYDAIWIHLRDLNSPGGLALIDEWRPLRLGEHPVYWLTLAASLALLGKELVGKDRRALAWAPLLVVFALWGSREARNPVYFILAAAPYLFSALDRGSVVLARRPGPLKAAAILALLVWLGAPVRRRDFSQAVRWSRLPVRACDFLEREGVGGVLHNDYAFGGFINWRFAGRRPVFMDGRYLFYPLLLEDASAGGPEGFQGLWDRHGVTYAVERRRWDGDPSPWRTRFPGDRWALVFWDDAALVFVRRIPAYGALIGRGEYRRVDPDDAEALLEAVRDGRTPKAAALAELDRHRARCGDTVTGALLRRQIAAL
ncbi:MAG: hypothetical protein A2X36_09395 [Elusimicrobia bacterium GWA2_69_24]|nr:MAG: hypothetical protein A2X36_09395 [Elusimicrobia bacterium GWA2_69_24]